MNYDIHVYWANDEERKEALKIRDSLVKLGLPAFQMVDVPIGPHPLPMFEAHASDSTIEDAEAEINKVRESCSVLIHEKTGDHIYDHTKGVRWIGKPLDLNIEFLYKMLGMHS